MEYDEILARIESSMVQAERMGKVYSVGADECILVNLFVKGHHEKLVIAKSHEWYGSSACPRLLGRSTSQYPALGLLDMRIGTGAILVGSKE
jgi:hypothetical protein